MSCPPPPRRTCPPLSPQRATRWGSYIDMFLSCIRTQIKEGVQLSSSSRVGRLQRGPLPPVVYTTSNSLVVVHRYVFIVYLHPGRRRGTPALEQSCRSPPRRSCPPLSPQRVTGGRTSVCFHRVFAPRFKKGDNSTLRTCVGRLHGGPVPRCHHSGQLISIVMIHRKGFNVYSRDGKNREEVIPIPGSCDSRSTTGLLPIVSTTGVFFSFFFRAGGTGYRPLPTRTNIQFKHDCIYQYVFIVHCLPTRRLPSSGQLILGLRLNRYVFIVYMHTPPFSRPACP